MRLTSFLLFFSVLCFNSTYAQDLKENNTLDHAIFIDKINNSQDLYFSEVLQKYNDYLLAHPKDVTIHIERCRFVELAQYDDYEEYNPNQELADSLSDWLFETYSKHPEVITYRIGFLWSDELDKLLAEAESDMEKVEGFWTNKNKSLIYENIANQHYNNEEYQLAYVYAEKTLAVDTSYNNTLSYVRILIKVDKIEKATSVLIANNDSTKPAWELNQKAKLLVEIDEFEEALKLYTLINKIDSSFNNNQELAKIMISYNRFADARVYLLQDTSNWFKDTPLLALFLHDLKYHGSDTALTSYNYYRDLGYDVDPLALYRLRLFFSHPTASLQARDFIGLLALLLLILCFVILPSVWILPIYFIGHHWKFITPEKVKDTIWGLKSFWWVSTGYFIASVVAYSVSPEYLNSLINDTNYYGESEGYEESLSVLLFMLTLACFGLSALYKVNLKILLYKHWSFWKCFGLTAAWFIGFKMVSAIYLLIGKFGFDMSIDQFSVVSNLLSVTAEINSLISGYGVTVSILTVAVLVPIYEEVIFRGVILDACKRYLNFKWANVLQALLFAAIHDDLTLFPLFFAFGMATGILRQRSGGLMSGICFHIVNNLLAMSVIIARG
jgi:CAAX protease family protein